MLFDRISPEKAGVRSAALARYIQLLERQNIPMHSLLMMKGEELFCETYWAPFDKDFCHRMYSQTKSYVSVAIGLLEEEGKLSLDAPIASYFPEKTPEELPPYLAAQTVRQMLTMTTSGGCANWFTSEEADRTVLYFKTPEERTRPAGTLWEYDSAGSQVMANLVEKLAGKSLFDYLDEKVFRHLGTFRTATILKTRNGDSWGDSALVCTPRDMASFARFVMNYGTWNGKRLMNEAYLRTATSALVSNRQTACHHAFKHGYGYQIWRPQQDGFAFVGMGNQLTVCLPEKDLIFVCTADCQGDEGTAREYIIDHFFELIVDELSDEPLPDDPEGEARLAEITGKLQLMALRGAEDSPFREELDGVTYALRENPMGISSFTFHFRDAESGELHYVNAQGKKVLPFGVNRNAFGTFPQFGYSNEQGGLRTTDGFLYDDAVSLAWVEEKKLLLYVQVIDRYFGTGFWIFAFRDDEVVVRMTKTAEDFLNEYTGTAIGKRI